MAIGADFITAGNATFTISGKSSRFTFKVTKKEAQPGSPYGDQPTFFVALLNGPDNTGDYCYVGILDPATGHVRLTRNSRVKLDSPSVKALHWALPKLWAKVAMPPAFEIRHEGRCGRCGRALTVPESIDTGFGPECAAELGLDWTKRERVSAQPVMTTAAARQPIDVGPKPDYDLLDVAFEEV